jgi:hypothetical protein
MPESLAARVSVQGPTRGPIAPINRKERMATSTHDADQQGRMVKLLAAGAEAELQLLRSERKAEKRLAEATASLADDEARLLRAQQRLERSRESVAAAEAALREVQARRAEGPPLVQD